MYAIVKRADETFYTSVVFGHFREYGECRFDDYYLVLNEEKTSLIKKLDQPPELSILMPQVLVVDTDQSGWNLIKGKYEYCEKLGVVSFLSHIDFMSDNWVIPEELLQRCIQIDAQQQYREFVDVTSVADLQNLEWVTGGFHDGVIQQKEEHGDSLYLYFDSMIGCEAELWFSGDVEYYLDGSEPDDYYPYWDYASMFIEDGYVYLSREGVSKRSDMTNGWWFVRAKKLRYRIVPIYNEGCAVTIK